MLRWVSPIQNMARTAARDVELRGQKIRAGQKVILLYPSANRDAKVFAEPFRFDIARRPNDHIAFGLGGHFCLGSNLARLELRVFFDRPVDATAMAEPLRAAAARAGVPLDRVYPLAPTLEDLFMTYIRRGPPAP